jgi:TPR repeat protein
MKKRFIPMLLAALFAAGSAHADLDQIKKAAEQGDVNAQLELGILYHYGFNYQDNEAHALAWYTIAANQGNAKAAGLRDALRAKMNQKDIDAAQTIIGEHRPKVAPAPAPAPAPAAPMPEMSPPPPAEAPAPAAAPADMPPAQPEAMPAPVPEAK